MEKLCSICEQDDCNHIKPTLIANRKPILFNTNMVRAIVNGYKTQTRRPISDYVHSFLVKEDDGYYIEDKYGDWNPVEHTTLNPFGSKGYKLWVRETWNESNDKYIYKEQTPENGYKWKPSIHMPFKATRIWLEVVNTKLELLPLITIDDALAEGMIIIPSGFNNMLPEIQLQWKMAAWKIFKETWDKIYPKKKFDTNPLIWKVEFRRIEWKG